MAAWKPPDQSDIQALKWLGIVGAMAAAIDILKGLSEHDHRSALERVAHGFLIMLLSIGIGALYISILRLPILAIIGLTAGSSFLGTEAMLEVYRWLTRKGSS